VAISNVVENLIRKKQWYGCMS